MESNTEVRDEVRGIIDALDDHRIVLRIPGTDYRLHLQLPDSAPPITTPVGKRITGAIEANALRIHPATGGGRFIEPIIGEPRIIAGRVQAVDEARRRVLVDVAVPMWLETLPDQDFGVIETGGMINCYVKSGTRFIPAAED